MSTIDFSKTQDVPAPDVARPSDHTDHTLRIKQDCSRKIAAHFDFYTLLNAQTAAVVGQLSKAEMRALADAQRWIEAMLRAARTAAKTRTAADWPAAPASAETLRARF